MKEIKEQKSTQLHFNIKRNNIHISVKKVAENAQTQKMFTIEMDNEGYSKSQRKIADLISIYLDAL